MRIASVLLHRRLGSLPVGNKHTHTHTHTTEHRKNIHDKTRNGRAQVRCDSRVALKLLVCAQECMTNAHGCIRRFCCGVDYSLNDWHLRVRHVVVRQVVACSVTSGRVAGAGGWFDVDVEARDAHQVDVHLVMRQISTDERNSDVDTGRTFMYSLPVFLLTLATALKPAVMRSGRPLQYPGMEV